MRILLPPSEAKTGGGRGRPLGAIPFGTVAGSCIGADAADALGAARAQVRAALHRLLDGDAADAARDLQLPRGVAADALARNADVGTSPTTPALRRYSGVVYDGLAYADLPADVQRIAHRDVLIFSGLFGVVRGGESIPDYRVPAMAALPGIGVAATFWRTHLDALLAGPAARRLLGGGVIVDLRSGDYAAMWRATGRHRERTISVRILSPLPRGGHGVVSFTSKLGKGRLAAALLAASARGDEPRTADDVAAAWLAAGGREAQPTPTGLDLYTAPPPA